MTESHDKIQFVYRKRILDESYTICIFMYDCRVRQKMNLFQASIYDRRSSGKASNEICYMVFVCSNSSGICFHFKRRTKFIRQFSFSHIYLICISCISIAASPFRWIGSVFFVCYFC